MRFHTYMLINSDINKEKSENIDSDEVGRFKSSAVHGNVTGTAETTLVWVGDTEPCKIQPILSTSGEDSPSGLICLTQQTYKYANCFNQAGAQ